MCLYMMRITLFVLQGLLVPYIYGLQPPNLHREIKFLERLNHLNGHTLKSKLDEFQMTSLMLAPQGITKTCRQHYDQLQIDKAGQQMYAIEFADSEAKLSSGIRKGNLQWWGSYDQCVEAKKVDNETQAVIFRGQYCRTTVRGLVNIGRCFPNSCSEQDVFQILTSDNTSLVTGISCPKVPESFDGGDIAAIVLCALLALLVVAGTAIDLTVHQADRSSTKLPPQGIMISCILSFSLVSNLPKLLSTKTRSGNIDALNGIRVFSLFWVILWHIFTNLIVASDNLSDFFEYPMNFYFQPLINATISVDTFYFMSGLLVCYLTLKQLEKGKGKINWFLFYFHRFWRLTPVYMFSIMLVATLVPHMMSGGPITDLISSVDRFCSQNWWANLLYIHNFYPKALRDVCVNWTWYLANEMQFYCISPVIIIALYRKPKIGLTIIGLLLAMCLLVRGIVSYEYDISPIFFAPVQNQAVFDHLYMRPYYRIAPYLTGLALGYYFWYTKLKITIPWPLAILGWIVAAVVNICSLYGLYGYYRDGNYAMDAGLVVYQTFHRWTWSLGVAWLVLACVANRGGWINTFLAWKGWIPFARLSYAAYLIHIPIVCLHTFSTHVPFHFDMYTLIYKFLGDVAITFMASLIVVLTIELPMLGIEKILIDFLPSLRQKKQSNDVDNIISGAKTSNNQQAKTNNVEINGYALDEHTNVNSISNVIIADNSVNVKELLVNKNGAHLPRFQATENATMTQF